MEGSFGLQVVSAYQPVKISQIQGTVSKPTAEIAPQDIDSVIIGSLSDSRQSLGSDSSVVKSTAFKSAEEILALINEQLSKRGLTPIQNSSDGQAITPVDYSPERVAETVTNGIMGLFEGFKRSNPELSEDEAVTRFFAAARKGVEQGYGEAIVFLENIGGLQYEGIEATAKRTLEVIQARLDELEAEKKRLNTDEIDPLVERVATSTSSGILTSTGKTLSQTSNQITQGTVSVVA